MDQDLIDQTVQMIRDVSIPEMDGVCFQLSDNNLRKVYKAAWEEYNRRLTVNGREQHVPY